MQGESVKTYTLEDLWKEYEKYMSWLDSRPPWWKFRARRKWKKAEPLNKKQEGESIRYGDYVELTDDWVKNIVRPKEGL